MTEHSIDEVFLEGNMKKYKLETNLEVKKENKKLISNYSFWIEYPWEVIKQYYNFFKVA